MHAIIKKLRIEGALVLHRRYHMGTFHDYSNNGNDGVGTATQWTNQGIRFNESTSEDETADSAELQLTTGALVFFNSLGFTKQGVSNLICKRDAGGTNYQLTSTATLLEIYDGANVRTLTTNIIGKKLIGVNMPTAGGTCEGFIDNISVGNFNGVSTFTADNAPLIIGNYFSGSVNFADNVSDVLIVNRILTATEWSELYSELSAMRWPTRPYTISNALLHVDPSESGLVGGWNMKPQGDRLPDLSPYGNDGTIYGARYEKTPLGDALVFDGVDDYVDIGNTGRTVKTVSFWLKAGSTTEDIIDLDGGTHTIEVNAGTITATGFDTPTIYTNAVVSSALSANLWHFVAITTATGFVASDLDIGRETTYLDAKMVGFRTHSDEKALSWVTREFQKGRTALFKTDWGVTKSIAAVASGPLEGSPFQVDSGTFKMSMDVIEGTPSGIQLLIDGDFEKVGVADWTAGASALLTKETTTPHGGSQCLRVAYNAVTNPYALQLPFTIGKKYKITGWGRGDGTGRPYIATGGLGTLWIGTTSNSWQYLNYTLTARATSFYIAASLAVAGYVEFDDITVELIPPNVKVIECVTAGICYVPTSYFQQTPTEAAFGTWEFWINKAAASSLKIHFIDATTGAGTGYYFDFAADESIEIYEVGVGSKFKTAVSYAAASTWHKLNILRTPAGVCSAYLNNTLIVKSTGDNPFTDITTTTSKYIVFDLDAGDLIAYADPKGKHNIVKKLISI